ncbi:hypothetical protein ATANTOWER_001594 [Ataeniobius toweri]|uniref:Uncharacterized protein n=1 Tax=Ataeniobius toweri TaxID=208326 RepID=A0ABU7A9J1_9TELE|nr:hypothetical protein [Ataeniobius toweri]
MLDCFVNVKFSFKHPDQNIIPSDCFSLSVIFSGYTRQPRLSFTFVNMVLPPPYGLFLLTGHAKSSSVTDYLFFAPEHPDRPCYPGQKAMLPIPVVPEHPNQISSDSGSVCLLVVVCLNNLCVQKLQTCLN